MRKFFSMLRSFPGSFWAANAIELLERWAYYGVRGGIAVYMVTAVALGGLGFDHTQKANIFLWWAMFQAILPIFLGGLTDYYGHRKSVAIAISITIFGYINMGLQHSYELFFASCVCVGIGTALFKPGLQGILANSTTGKNATLGWSFFYMIVNIGGFIGPLLAGYLRLDNWRPVFFVSAAIHALNFIFLFSFKYKNPVAKEKAASFTEVMANVGKLFWSSITNLGRPGLLVFLLVFSGFWLMFMQLFDLLPNYITDWVDTSLVYQHLGAFFDYRPWIDQGAAQTQLPAEWFINLDAGTIIVLMLPIGMFFKRYFAVSAMTLGIVVATVGLVMAGLTMNPWWTLLGIFIFAIGEMIASPRKSEFLAMIAPPEEKGLYMGYVNFPVGIGWVAGSKLAGYLYQNFGDKVTLAKKYLMANFDYTAAQVDAISKENVLPTLQGLLQHASPWETTTLLFNTYQPYHVWWILAAIGITSMFGMLYYNMRFGHRYRHLAEEGQKDD